MQKTVALSAYINVSTDVIDKGRSFVNKVNKVRPKTKPCGTPHLTCVFEVFLLLIYHRKLRSYTAQIAFISVQQTLVYGV